MPRRDHARRSVQLSAPRNIPDLKIVWLAEPGSHIKAGDVVVRFDASGAKRQLDEQTATLNQSKASLAQALAQARMTSEQDKLDLASARYDVDRAKLEASKQAIVSVLQGESSKVDLATAESKLRVEEATVELHRKSDESKVASIQRQLEKAQADVDLTTRAHRSDQHARTGRRHHCLSDQLLPGMDECAAFQGGRSGVAGRCRRRDSGYIHSSNGV